MSEGVGAILFIGGIFVAYGVIVGWLDRRAVLIERERLDLESKLPPGDMPPSAGEFLRAVDRSIALSADLRAEIRAELTAHLEDSIAALEAEGLDRDAAAREATARLGRPEELARQLRAAHQTTRRLLAGAAGGVFWTGIGLFEGWLISILVFLVLAVPGSVVTARLGPVLPVAIDSDALATNTVLLCFLEAGAAFVAARRASTSIARTTRRDSVLVARVWALAGAGLITSLVLFVVPVQQSMLVPPAELGIAAAFAAGALTSPGGRRLRFPGGPGGLAAVAGSLVLISFLVLFATSSSAGSTLEAQGTSSPAESRGWTRVAPWYPEAHGEGAAWVMGGGDSTARPDIDYTAHLDVQALSGWRDIRFEAWRSKPVRGTGFPLAVDPAFTAPFAIVTARPDAQGDCSVRFDLSHVRSTRDWTIFATATSPDGHRYIVGFPRQQQTVFSGTIWDWVTAAE